MERASGNTVRGRISNEAVEKATGRGWDAWLEVLDDAGAVRWSHPEIVAHLERAHPEVDSGWWRQSITVAYEQARDKRVVGQTADAGFQVGVQRSVASTPEEVWDLICERPELWLGTGKSVVIEEGAQYETDGGGGTIAAAGEVRVVKRADRIRLTWRPEGWEAPATLQIALSTTKSGKTAIITHLEKLPDADARELMREHWRGILGRLGDALRKAS